MSTIAIVCPQGVKLIDVISAFEPLAKKYGCRIRQSGMVFELVPATETGTVIQFTPRFSRSRRALNDFGPEAA